MGRQDLKALEPSRVVQQEVFQCQAVQMLWKVLETQ